MTLSVFAVLASLSALSLPNPVLTPGVIRPLTKAQICSTKWGTDRRFVTQKMKKQVAAAYGVPWKDHAKYEFDHKIPRALSGDDKIGNLWPEPLWEAKHLKDPLEVKLWHMVCAGEIELNDAQGAFMTDWRVSYRRFVGDIQQTKKK